jgi:RNA polymerase sigma factor (sigma-70 family)
MAICADNLTDRQLLERFAARRDEEAFAQLVRRHGPLVLRVCRQMLRHQQDAEDAFQATFLVLARKAGSIRKAESLPSWLYGVASRLAGRMRTAGRRRRAREVALVETPTSEARPGEDLGDLGPVLFEEIGRLPDKCRVPFVLCYLQGKTNEQAAEQLGCPAGTVFSRLARARELLRQRLTRRGLALSGAVLAATLSNLPEQASAAVPPRLAAATVRRALRFGSGNVGGDSKTPARVVGLAEWGAKSLSGRRLRTAVALLMLLALLTGIGALLLRHRPPEGPVPPPQEAGESIRERLQGTWVMTSVTHDGVPVPGAEGELTFKDDQMTLAGVSGTYRIDAAKDPMQLDWTAQGRVLRVALELRGDELTLSRTQSPEFGPQPGKAVMTFKRLRN